MLIPRCVRSLQLPGYPDTNNREHRLLTIRRAAPSLNLVNMVFKGGLDARAQAHIVFANFSEIVQDCQLFTADRDLEFPDLLITLIHDEKAAAARHPMETKGDGDVVMRPAGSSVTFRDQLNSLLTDLLAANRAMLRKMAAEAFDVNIVEGAVSVADDARPVQQHIVRNPVSVGEYRQRVLRLVDGCQTCIWSAFLISGRVADFLFCMHSDEVGLKDVFALCRPTRDHVSDANLLRAAHTASIILTETRQLARPLQRHNKLTTKFLSTCYCSLLPATSRAFSWLGRGCPQQVLWRHAPRGPPPARAAGEVPARQPRSAAAR